jgi:predicted helicase
VSITPSLRRHFGVYETPPHVVGAHVRLINDVLRQHFGVAGGFADERVVVIDPAVGGGAYPRAVAEVAEACLAGRMHLFEARPEEAECARARLNMPVHVRDVLAEPLAVDGQLLVCLGNPPYNRQVVAQGVATPRKGGWVRFGRPRPLLADFTDESAGLHLKSLYNDYVYFWRWALWAVFDQRRGPGIVSFVTPSSYLHGPGFGGMRRWLRRTVDELWIVDLEGDGRGTRPTQNVFEGVQTPVAIAIAARCAGGGKAQVQYAGLTGSREAKLARLGRVHTLNDLPWQAVPGGPDTAPLLPSIQSAYQSWPSLTELLPRQYSGCQVKRKWPIAPDPEVLRRRWTEFLRLSPEKRERAFRSTRDRSTASTPSGTAALKVLPSDSPCPRIVPYGYRSFDRQWLLHDARLGDFLRASLWRIAGPRQMFLTTLLTHPLGAGPSAVATRLVPDLDHFRGSFGGRAVIPLWLDATANEPNVADGLLQRLSSAYGRCVEPRELFGYCYALLSTPSYQARFADELRMPGPRVPITGSVEVFSRAARLGEQLLRLHTYVEVPRRETPVSPDVWRFSVSGLPVVKSWLRRRLGMWSPTMRQEFWELLWLLEATIELQPELDRLLEDATRTSQTAVTASASRPPPRSATVRRLPASTP